MDFQTVAQMGRRVSHSIAPLPDQATLKALLRYEPETGRLFWRERPQERFACRWAYLVWNKSYANTEAFTARRNSGYRTGRIFDRQYQAHRVIWKMMTGSDPLTIDHINGDAGDNRWGNLRDVSDQINKMNAKKPITNTSGLMGVSAARNGRWRACIRDKGRYKHLGHFDTVEDAHAAWQKAKTELGYHPNHGRD